MGASEEQIRRGERKSWRVRREERGERERPSDRREDCQWKQYFDVAFIFSAV